MPTPTLLPLDTFRDIISYNPYHFWQQANSLVPLNSACNTLLRETAWLSAQSAGREEIRKAIAEAEKQLRKQLKYDISTVYNEEILPVGYLRTLPNGNKFPIQWWQNGYWSRESAIARLSLGKVTRIATRTLTYVSDVSVVYADKDGDGIQDTFTATWADTLTSLSDFEAYFISADRPANTDLNGWKIAPVSFTRVAGNVLASGASWMLAKPMNLRQTIAFPGTDLNTYGVDTSGEYDPNVSANFVTKIAIYQKVYAKENIAYVDLDCCGTISTVEVCATLVDGGTGEVQLSFDSCGLTYCACNGPSVQSVRINYEAGDDLDAWKVTVARFALAELRRGICSCAEANREAAEWQANLASVGNQMLESFRVPDEILTNPFGSKAGAAYAWQRVKDKRVVRGFAL